MNQNISKEETAAQEPDTKGTTVNQDSRAFEAIRHWSEFGRRGSTPARRVVASDWHGITSFSRPKTASWDYLIPKSEVARIILGVQPRQMEDKWFVYSDGPDETGLVTVHMHRSWTGYKVVELEMKVDVKAKDVTTKDDCSDEGARFTRITWETYENPYREPREKVVKEKVLELCRYCMGANV